MKFERHAETVGSHLIGEITARYSDLVRIFGAPLDDVDGYKVSTEWVMQFEDGTVATIYDYKATKLYDPDSPAVEEFRAMADHGDGYEWHVGGFTSAAVERVREALAANMEERTPPAALAANVGIKAAPNTLVDVDVIPATHTAGDLRLDDSINSHVISEFYHLIEAGKGFFDRQTATGFQIGGFMNKYDAARIVHTWNCHDGLARALSDLIEVSLAKGLDSDALTRARISLEAATGEQKL